MKKIFIWGFFISWHPNLVPPKNLGRLDTPILGSSLEIFDFKSQKKIIFFLFWLKIKFALIFSLIEKKKIFLPALEGFFADFFADFSIIFDDFFHLFLMIFFNYFLKIFLKILVIFLIIFLIIFWWIFWWFLNNLWRFF